MIRRRITGTIKMPKYACKYALKKVEIRTKYALWNEHLLFKFTFIVTVPLKIY